MAADAASGSPPSPPAAKTFALNNGVTMPAIGFGTFANEGAKGETYRAVTKALEVGYRHLDCAWFYHNEGEVGDALRDFLAANPHVSRADVFICTKVWNHLHAPEDVAWSIRDSCANLKVDHVDLFLVHWPVAAEKNPDRTLKMGPDGKYVINRALTANPEPTWRAMEALVDAGLARSIGVSNWTIPGLQQLLAFARIPPAVNQIEIHPFLPNAALVNFCVAHGIVPAAYSPLGSQNQVPSTGETVRQNAALNAVAQRSGHNLAQVLLAWGLRRGYVVLPKSSTPARIESNLQVPVLSDEDFAAIEDVARGRHVRFVNMKDTFGYDVWPEES
ncbi:NADP-dependent oxidoreductase domain-containing protein [Lasiosphaeria miniovina]|uniref:NADP-dependent oxidoreductase domain-containing protein n=1 Tax=Lasiosphaeria miniovina TaxID=1954250 RepID=A0AA40AMF4_9PEZI|nr:NADP-dependent oxidoreductase domain-containing protein [Lasiosphaeria miniovina]KAK0718546.1 NADP-dependent oxidoreductase domain-containing protein [Lasiosphaeria miniovina]